MKVAWLHISKTIALILTVLMDFLQVMPAQAAPAPVTEQAPTQMNVSTIPVTAATTATQSQPAPAPQVANTVQNFLSGSNPLSPVTYSAWISYAVSGYTWGRSVSGDVKALANKIADKVGPDYKVIVSSDDWGSVPKGTMTCDFARITVTYKGDTKTQAQPGQLSGFSAVVNAEGKVVYQTNDPVTGKRIRLAYTGDYPSQEPSFSATYFPLTGISMAS